MIWYKSHKCVYRYKLGDFIVESSRQPEIENRCMQIISTISEHGAWTCLLAYLEEYLSAVNKCNRQLSAAFNVSETA